LTISSKTLGFGIVGCGVIAPTHAEAIAATDGARLVAVCDVDPAKAQKIGEQYDVPYYTDLAAFSQHPNLEVASICVPSGLHASVGIPLAKSGKHLLVEKPIEVSVPAAQALIQACAEAQVTLGVISQHRFAPDVLKVREAVQSGELGQLVLGEAMIKWYRTQKYYDSAGWRGTYQLDGGGALMNQGIHYIDLLQWIMGPVASVKAATITRTHQIEVEDVGVAILHFANGALGSITGSTSVYPGLPERLEIHGSDGTAIIESDKLKSFQLRQELGNVGDYGMAAKLREQASQPSVPTPVPAEPKSGAANPAAIGAKAHAWQIADFVAAIRDNRPPAITGQDALRPLELILAIYRAAKSNCEVFLNETIDLSLKM
jgi:UDP-N-acetyl-2-amino-2-deoxyglucuronate dehydrogenase